MIDRTADPRVLPIIVERWSPRSFDASDLPQADLDVIFEAAGWAPSASNIQPWRFLYAHRADTALFQTFLDLLVPANQAWAKDASVLMFVLSEETAPGRDGVKPNRSHSFDAGSAWVQLALQATAMGYRAHGMAGVDFDRARAVLAVPANVRIEAGVALGRQAPADHLPEAYRAREVPSARKPVSEIAWPGAYRA